MNKLILIQVFTALLCISMIADITIPVDDVIQITAEADSETESEHEENKESGKEKNTSMSALRVPTGSSFWSKNRLDPDGTANWKSPLIDFHTPPPELR